MGPNAYLGPTISLPPMCLKRRGQPCTARGSRGVWRSFCPPTQLKSAIHRTCLTWLYTSDYAHARWGNSYSVRRGWQVRVAEEEGRDAAAEPAGGSRAGAGRPRRRAVALGYNLTMTLRSSKPAPDYDPEFDADPAHDRDPTPHPLTLVTFPVQQKPSSCSEL